MMGPGNLMLGPLVAAQSEMLQGGLYSYQHKQMLTRASTPSTYYQK
jgi:hypothetical protein